MAWQPEPQQLHQLAQCLRDSLSGHDAAAQKKAEMVRDWLGYWMYLRAVTDTP